jgi:hypothetical protein
MQLTPLGHLLAPWCSKNPWGNFASPSREVGGVALIVGFLFSLSALAQEPIGTNPAGIVVDSNGHYVGGMYPGNGDEWGGVTH